MTILEPMEGCGCDSTGPGDPLITLDEALARIAVQIQAVNGTEQVALADAYGRVLAEPVVARAMLPPFDNSAMDGYAVRVGDLAGSGPWRLDVTARIPAGHPAGADLPPGAAARIFTGARVPAGADAVIMQEQILRSSDAIVVSERPLAGTNIRRSGDDMARGAPVLAEGHKLGVREIAACAAAGQNILTVRRRIRVALLATGDEVRQAGAPLGPSEIWDVNTPMLGAALSEEAVEVIAVQSCPDDPDALGNFLAEIAGRADLIITTGGISVGDLDHVGPALRTLGAGMVFGGVAIKPGKPVALGRLDTAFVLALPGNPLSAFVTWGLLGRAVLDRLCGRNRTRAPRRHAVTGCALQHPLGRCEFRPARLTGYDGLGREVVTCGTATHSARIAGLAQMDGLVLIPGDVEMLPEGALVEFRPFGDR